MKYDNDRPQRRSMRLKGYNYAAAAAYFVTTVLRDRACRFGTVVDGEMHLSDAGRAIVREWTALADRFPEVDLDQFVLMPNHLHGIIVLNPSFAGAVPSVVGATLVVARVGDGGNEPRAGPSPAPTDEMGPSCDDGAMSSSLVGAALVVARGPVDAVEMRAGTSPAPTIGMALTPDDPRDASPTLGAVVGTFKSLSTLAYMRGVRESAWSPFRSPLWQRNYYEHVIRSEDAMDRIRDYIDTNSVRWEMDRENPSPPATRPAPGRRPAWEV